MKNERGCRSWQPLFLCLYGAGVCDTPFEFCEYNVECNTNNNPVPGLDGYRAKPRCRSIGIMILVHPPILVWRAVP